MSFQAHNVLRFTATELKRWDQFTRDLLAGGTPALRYPANKPLDLEPGDEITLKTIGFGKQRAPQVWLVIEGTTRHKSGHQAVHYRARDDRPWMLHKDSSHGYTRNPGLALDPEAESVDERTLAKQTKEARERDVRYDQEHRTEQVAEREMRRLGNKVRRVQGEAMKHGVDIAPQLQAFLESAQERISEAKEAA